MTQMPVATPTTDFQALHSVEWVIVVGNTPGEGFGERRPARSRVVFLRGVEKRLPAANASILPGFIAVEMFTAPAPFRLALTQNSILIGGQLLFPAIFGQWGPPTHRKRKKTAPLQRFDDALTLS
jgi:hypothetical protein